MTGQHFTIKQTAELTGLSSYTLRYYEELGLIDAVPRAANGHRRYAETDLARIRLLVRLRDTGMSLEDMLHFVSLYREGTTEAVAGRYALLAAHREKVQMQIAALCDTLAYIDHKLTLYEEQIANGRERQSSTCKS